MDGNVEKCAGLIADGFDPNAFDDGGNTPLHYAAEKERLEVVALLISHGANVNSIDKSKIGDTPLSYIAQTCSLKMAEILLDAGADPTIGIGLSGSAIDKAKNRKRGDGQRVYELFRQFADRTR
jgi:ankyrin repeat protein